MKIKYNMDSGWHLEGVDGSSHVQHRLLEWTDSLLTHEEPRAGKWKDLARSAQRVDGLDGLHKELMVENKGLPALNAFLHFPKPLLPQMNLLKSVFPGSQGLPFAA